MDASRAVCVYCQQAGVQPPAPPAPVQPQQWQPPAQYPPQYPGQPQYPPAAPPYGYAPYPTAPPGNYIWSPPGVHSTAVALILAILLGGWVGQLYNRQVAKSLVFLLLTVLMFLVTCGWSVLLTWPLTVIDAGVVASRISKGEPVGYWQWF